MKSKNDLSCYLDPLFIVYSAISGDVEVVNIVLKSYTFYINKLSLRIIYDIDGVPHKVVDKYMRRRLETKLIADVIIQKNNLIILKKSDRLIVYFFI